MLPITKKILVSMIFPSLLLAEHLWMYTIVSQREQGHGKVEQRYLRHGSAVTAFQLHAVSFRGSGRETTKRWQEEGGLTRKGRRCHPELKKVASVDGRPRIRGAVKLG
ncbi:hypothetical protein C8J56DRAFT_993461 [Mycena floridula]|nr:hypothetical protein C8J56DRAFT_993821 [Mycena floridula]KAJ7572116.1 hypothetical protein C8J56DRAFT_993461 [Mycena floridula]